MAPKQLLIVALAGSVTACAALTSDPRPEENAEIRLDRGLFALDAGRYSAAFEDLAWVYDHCSGHQAGSRALLALAALELDPRNAAARPGVGAELLGRVIQDPATTRWVRPLAETAFLESLALGASRPQEGDAGENGEPGSVEGAADTMADTTAPVVIDIPAVAPIDSATPALEGARDDDHAGMPAVLRADTPVASPVRGCGPAVARGAEWTAPRLPELPGPSMAALLATSEARRDSMAATARTLRAELEAVTEQLRLTEEELERIRKTLKP